MPRVLALFYGVVSYLVFLATFTYAIGFVTGLGVPKHIDSGLAGPLLPALLVNAALLGLFAAQHSVMARPAFKRWLTRFVPEHVERSTYVLCASLALVAMFAWWRPMPSPVWQVETPALYWMLHALSACGWLLVLVGTFLISHCELFGLRQVWLHARGKTAAHLPFVTRSLYRVVRHPLMLGFLIAFWATPQMSQGHLLFALATTGYIVLAVKLLEERDLVAMHGEAYRRYQREVPMLLPLPKRREPVGSVARSR